ncbi:hypothetical protein [Streptomyces sp. ST1015]|uniref:hypothetical protein n=1 Tax=Streptomyces sp. ST1015 TaxID=1848900 RepID=UPI00223B9909|nr:hypothetical protein [Streptomyces sp. ST1015]
MLGHAAFGMDEERRVRAVAVPGDEADRIAVRETQVAGEGDGGAFAVDGLGPLAEVEETQQLGGEQRRAEQGRGQGLPAVLLGEQGALLHGGGRR